MTETGPTPAGVRARLEGGEQLVGAFVQSGDPAVLERFGRLGFDFVCIEGEHSGLGVETVQRLVAAAERTPAPALVRVAGNDPIAIAAVLDAGAAGVIVPRIDSGADAARAVAAARYPPRGERGLGPSRATGYGYEIGAYLQRANDELLLAVQVETYAAIDRLDELLAVPGIDLLFVGPGDLACSLGIADPRSPELRSTIEDVLARARAGEYMTGIFAASPEDARHWRSLGVNLVILGSDLMWLARGASDALAALG